MKRKPKERDVYLQQRHKGCTSSLVVVAHSKTQQIAIVCLQCKAIWAFVDPLGTFPVRSVSDWEDGTA